MQFMQLIKGDLKAKTHCQCFNPAYQLRTKTHKRQPKWDKMYDHQISIILERMRQESEVT